MLKKTILILTVIYSSLYGEISGSTTPTTTYSGPPVITLESLSVDVPDINDTCFSIDEIVELNGTYFHIDQNSTSFKLESNSEKLTTFSISELTFESSYKFKRAYSDRVIVETSLDEFNVSSMQDISTLVIDGDMDSLNSGNSEICIGSAKFERTFSVLPDSNFSDVSKSLTVQDIQNITKNEDSGAFYIDIEAISDDSNITYEFNSSNRNFASFSLNGNRVTVSPYSNRYGTATVWVKATNSYGVTDSDSFTITVNSINDSPILSNTPTNRVYNEDFGSETVSFSINDYDTSDSHSATFTSSNESVVTVKYLSNSSFQLNSVKDSFGTSTIDISVTDSKGASVSTSFSITVNPVNDSPVIDEVQPVTILEDSEAISIPITIKDVDSEFTTQLTGGDNSIIEAKFENSTLIITPVENSFGKTTLTITASDGESSSSIDIPITVEAQNDLPTFIVKDIEFLEDSNGEFTLEDFQISDIDGDKLSYSITSSGEIAKLRIENGKILYETIKDSFGEESITLTISDGVESVSQEFSLNIKEVNDLPILDPISDIDFEINRDFSKELEFTFWDDKNIERVHTKIGSEDIEITHKLSENSDSGVLTITLLNSITAGDYSAKVTIFDQEGESSSVDFVIAVRENLSELCVENSIKYLDFEIIRGDNESSSYITEPLTLPNSSECGATFKWLSNQSDIVDENGNIFRDPDSDRFVLLEVTASLQDFNSSRNYMLTVIQDGIDDNETLQKSSDALTFDLIKGSNSRRDSIQSDLILPDHILSASIEWSSNSNLISSSGEVFQDQNDTAVKLTAKLTFNDLTVEKVFDLVVIKTVSDPLEIIKRDLEWLNYSLLLKDNFSSRETITDLNFPKNAPNGSLLIWHSSAEESISNSGRVNQGEKDQTVVVRVSAKIEEDSESKEFIFTVLQSETEEEKSDLQLKKIDDNESGLTVTFEGEESKEESEITLSFDKNLTIDRKVTDSFIETSIELEESTLKFTISKDGDSRAVSESKDGEVSQISIGAGDIQSDISKDKFKMSQGDISAELDFLSGELSLSVGSGEKSSKASSKIKGSEISIKDDNVETTYSEVVGGKIIKAIILTDKSGNSFTKYEMQDLNSGETLNDLSSTTETPFESGSTTELRKEKINGKERVVIDIKAPLSKKITID